MRSNFKKILATTILSGMLASCMTSSNVNNKNPSSQNQNEVKNQNAEQAEYSVTGGSFPQANYEEATKINSELAIIYSIEGYLERAKTKLIKAQELANNHNQNLAIVDYAGGYYYQSIGANSIAEKYYQKALDNHPKNYEAMNFYAQFLCTEKEDYSRAQELFEKALFMPNNNDMAQTLFLYSQCMYKQGKKDDALAYMQRADKFRIDYKAAKLRLAQMYFERGEYKECYKVIYSMKNDPQFFNNKLVLDMRLKLAEYANNKNEAAAVRLVLSSNNYNDEDIDKFFSAADQKDIDKNA
ncbi:tetratricopeptide repeat protein [Francisella philomiragia]|uniref:tetratricopeptide repeat protein n=1 Tax=Francisella philomiragia TaxID=28110 RepID=UPI001B8CA2AF|nr:CDC27 family protein [Francisella philomiragia]QUE32311.1 pilus assembly protein PilF [Francisella philomiragia]